MAAQQPQQAMAAIPDQSQQIVLAQEPALPQQGRNQAEHKQVIKRLAIAEIVLGSACVILGVVALFFPFFYFTFVFSIGEGIWCGVWIIIAGALGVPSSRPNSTKSLIISHLALSIVGAVFAAVIFSFAMIGIATVYQTEGLIIVALVAVVSFSSIVLLIVSACYCGSVVGYCRQAQPYQAVPQQGQTPVVYKQLIPISTQSAQGAQTTSYIMQDYQLGTSTIPNVAPQPIQPPVQLLSQPNPTLQNPTTKQETFGQLQMQTNPVVPPAYSSVPE